MRESVASMSSVKFSKTAIGFLKKQQVQRPFNSGSRVSYQQMSIGKISPKSSIFGIRENKIKALKEVKPKYKIGMKDLRMLQSD